MYGRVWLIFAFGAPFLVIPSLAHHFVVALLFESIGLVVVACGCFAALFRQVIVDDGEQLVVEIDLLGKPIHSETVLKRDAERLEIRAVGGRSRAVHLEASAGRSYCLGACLAQAELEWLRRTVARWLAT